jgi:hypothetical protein
MRMWRILHRGLYRWLACLHMSEAGHSVASPTGQAASDAVESQTASTMLSARPSPAGLSDKPAAHPAADFGSPGRLEHYRTGRLAVAARQWRALSITTTCSPDSVVLSGDRYTYLMCGLLSRRFAPPAAARLSSASPYLVSEDGAGVSHALPRESEPALERSMGATNVQIPFRWVDSFLATARGRQARRNRALAGHTVARHPVPSSRQHEAGWARCLAPTYRASILRSHAPDARSAQGRP